MDIFQMSLSASVLIVAVVMIRGFTLHKLPKKTFLLLWGVVICRLLIPFSIPSRFSFYTGIDTAKRMLAERTAVSPVGITGISNIANTPATREPIAMGVSAASISPFEIVWLAGMCACALFFIVAYIKCRREFKMSLPVENDLAARWLREPPMLRPVQIRQSDRISAPLTYGIFHPVILLPKKTDWMDEARLKVILTHELVHIRSFDTLIKLVLTAVMCVHWFNPLVWIMYVLANRDIELSCDEAVVRTFGETIKLVYALTLIGMEEKKSRLTPLISGFSKNAIEERITAIMKMKKTSVITIVLALCLVIGTTVAFATSAAAPKGPEPNTTKAQPISDDMNETVSDDNWVWPVEGYDRVTSLFGKRLHPVTGEYKFHDHIDIAGNGVEGATVYAALAGIVSETGFDDEQGNYITIAHDNGIETIYRHLAETLVSAGDPVAQGGKIGTVGATGNATGPHLAFGVYVDGEATDPIGYFK